MVAPSADDLTQDSRGQIGVPATAEQGSIITVELGAAAEQWSGVWLFSAPVHLATLTADTDGVVEVRLPDSVTGEHRIAAYARDESLIGWDTITITTADGGDENGDGDDAAEDGGATDGDTTGAHGGSELPNTGLSTTAATTLAVAALLLLTMGVLLRRMSRA